MIQVHCSNCGIQILVPSTVQGKSGICFNCGAALKVPVLADALRNINLNFAVGDRISNRYVIEAPIGKGGMGVVYRAHDTLVNEEVALKFMNPRLLCSQEAQLAFIQEAQIARRLRHENIVAVHDVGWTPEGILYLSMEFLKGSSLRDVLRKHRTERVLMDVRLGVDITARILDALEYAHRTVIHRDLKPENIMMLPGEHVKVLDFGLAIAADEESGSAEPHSGGVSAAGQLGKNRVTGTIAYAAPEQKKRHDVDWRADLYAVGLIFYELLTLRTPLDDYLEIPRARNDVAPSLVAIYERAVRPDKEDRWPSAAEFRQKLLDAFEESYREVSAAAVEMPEGKTVSTEGMILLKGGHFVMGNDEVPEEAPAFETHVDPFYIDKYPVTVNQYAAFLEATRPSPVPKFWDDPKYKGGLQPVIGVTWADAHAYAAWAGKQLPTEAQWEFAARGRENRKYPWGNQEPDSNRCNFNDHLSIPSIVTMYEEGATPDGVCDLAGNVYEWTQDPFLPYQKEHSPEQSNTPVRVIRGGSWESNEHEVRCAHRRGLFRESRLNTVGFRCVVPLRK